MDFTAEEVEEAEFMVNRIRPVKPRYNEMWDIRILYNYFANLKQKSQREAIKLRTKAIILI